MRLPALRNTNRRCDFAIVILEFRAIVVSLHLLRNRQVDTYLESQIVGRSKNYLTLQYVA